MHNRLQSPSAGISRRAFLGKGGLMLGGLGLLGGFAASDMVGAAQAPPRPPVKPVDLLPWKELRASLSGGLLRPGETGYAKTAAPWNQRFSDRLPAGIALCSSSQDVVRSMAWADSFSLPIAIRAGGHSTGGYSNTRGLQLDLAGLGAVSYDPETTLLTIGGGVRSSQIQEALQEHGRAIPTPRVGALGVGGLVLGGGLTPDMRQRGLLCDQLQRLELVTGRGSVLNCDREENPDLFWACRGGGASQLGVVTSMVLKTFPVEDLTVYRIVWESDLEDIFPTLIGLLPEASERLGAELNLTVRSGRPVELELIGQLQGSPDELADILDALYQIALPREEKVESFSYWDGKQVLAQVAAPTFQAQRNRYAYSDFAVQACDKVLEQLVSWPGTSGEARWSTQLLGRMVDNVGRRSTAYVHRGAKYLTSAGMTWSKNDSDSRVQASLAWLDGFHNEMERFTSHESSQNWPDPQLKDFGLAYFGENLRFLANQRREADPDRVLHFEQTVSSSSDLLTSN